MRSVYLDKQEQQNNAIADDDYNRRKKDYFAQQQYQWQVIGQRIANQNAYIEWQQKEAAKQVERGRIASEAAAAQALRQGQIMNDPVYQARVRALNSGSIR
jgi:hypothetical protein